MRHKGIEVMKPSPLAKVAEGFFVRIALKD
jgi:hypothetical protein